ncbi:MAG: sensor histidine kinase, partial [Nevskiales bacterium]
MVWDLTQQKRQQDALRRMEERYRLTTRSARVGVWVWDAIEGTSEIDESLRILFDFPTGPTDKLRLKVDDFLVVVHPDDRARLATELRDLIRSSAPEYFFEFRIVLKNGEVRGVQSRGMVFRDENRRALQIAGVTWDATQLMEARHALEQKTQELERSNKELDDFTYIASHDLKEPLRGISNYVQFMEEDYADKLDDKGRGMLQKMREQARRMETLIMELLNVARMGRAQLAIQNTDLQATLAEILASLEFSINERKVQIRVPRPLPSLRCDRVRVSELFRNLITNGIRYNDKPERWLEIGYNGTVQLPTFYVRDNGIGIRPDHHGQVFEMFKR